MAFWNTEKLKQQCEAHQLITPFRKERAMRCAYELGVGSEVYITSSDSDTTHLDANAKVKIPPGQFALLITHETVYVPPTAIAFISIRARIKFQGLVNVSGFHVDPGYRGKLKFAVYNAGSTEIVLDQDQRVFMIWFADLSDPSPDPYPSIPEASSTITSEDVRRLAGEVASPAELKKKIDEVKHEYDKRIRAIELSETILRGLVVGLFIALLVTMLKAGMFDRTTEQKQPASSQTAPKADAQQPEVGQSDALPQSDEIKQIVGYGTSSLGWWIVGSSLLLSASILLAAYILRSRSGQPRAPN